MDQKQQQQQIEHSHLEIRGLSLHIAQAGTGESGTVVFLHGFPEIWYSWRHQMIAVAAAGFRAIAPDFRGYGLSDQPPEPEKATWADLVDDLLGILDSLRVSKAFIIGKDFGAMAAYNFVLCHPDRVSGVATLGIPFLPRAHFESRSSGPKALPEGFYITRFREPGRQEKDFARVGAKTAVRNIYILFSRSEVPIAAEGQEIMDLVDPSTPLPPWFTEEDLEAYGALYEKSGFSLPLQIPYRASPVVGGADEATVEVPALFVLGEKDYFLKFPGVEDYIKSGMMKQFVPNLEIASIAEGGHFVQEQFPGRVNQLIVDFLARASKSSSEA